MPGKKTTFISLMILLLSIQTDTFADWRISLAGGASSPIGQLNDWFRYGMDLETGIGQYLDNNWYVEGILHYASFTKNNLTGYSKDNLDLYLEHLAIWVNGKYFLYESKNIRFYYNMAGGPLYWKGIRGEILENESIALPHIDEKILGEWNMGFRTGFGSEIIINNFGFDFSVGYRFIAGSLWPTMQEYIELEGVNGFQSLLIHCGLFYEF